MEAECTNSSPVQSNLQQAVIDLTGMTTAASAAAPDAVAAAPATGAPLTSEEKHAQLAAFQLLRVPKLGPLANRYDCQWSMTWLSASILPADDVHVGRDALIDLNARHFIRGMFGTRLSRLVCGDLKTAFVSNYMIDLPWMLSAMPDLLRAGQRSGLIIAHGESAEL